MNVQPLPQISSPMTPPDAGFMETSNIVAKFAFLIMCLFLFIVFLRVGIALMSRHFTQKNPKLINGMIQANQMMVFPQDPVSSTTIYRSVNGEDGIEFTWAVWIFVDNINYLEGQYKHIFYKGNNSLDKNGMNQPNNAPGVYLVPNTNAVMVVMNTYQVINEELIIPDIPLNKWVSIIIRCKNKTIDVFINGTIARSMELLGVPKQNYGDVYVCANGGFSGYLSNLWYYDYAIGTKLINEIVRNGPSTNLIGSSGDMAAVSNKMANYLSLRWFV